MNYNPHYRRILHQESIEKGEPEHPRPTDKCIECNEKVSLRYGDTTRPHWVHKVDRGCEWRGERPGKGEGENHAKSKELLCEWLNTRVVKVKFTCRICYLNNLITLPKWKYQTEIWEKHSQKHRACIWDIAGLNQAQNVCVGIEVRDSHAVTNIGAREHVQWYEIGVNEIMKHAKKLEDGSEIDGVIIIENIRGCVKCPIRYSCTERAKERDEKLRILGYLNNEGKWTTMTTVDTIGDIKSHRCYICGASTNPKYPSCFNCNSKRRFTENQVLAFKRCFKCKLKTDGSRPYCSECYRIVKDDDRRLLGKWARQLGFCTPENQYVKRRAVCPIYKDICEDVDEVTDEEDDGSDDKVVDVDDDDEDEDVVDEDTKRMARENIIRNRRCISCVDCISLTNPCWPYCVKCNPVKSEKTKKIKLDTDDS